MHTCTTEIVFGDQVQSCDEKKKVKKFRFIVRSSLAPGPLQRCTAPSTGNSTRTTSSRVAAPRCASALRGQATRLYGRGERRAVALPSEDPPLARRRCARDGCSIHAIYTGGAPSAALLGGLQHFPRHVSPVLPGHTRERSLLKLATRRHADEAVRFGDLVEAMRDPDGAYGHVAAGGQTHQASHGAQDLSRGAQARACGRARAEVGQQKPSSSAQRRWRHQHERAPTRQRTVH